MCDGLKRLIVHQSRYDELIEKLSQKLSSKKIGNALEESTDIGPIISAHQQSNLEKQLNESLSL